MLEVFRNFEITGDQAKFTNFLSQLSKSLPSGWKRNANREKEIRHASAKDARTFVFSIAPQGERPAANLFLMRSAHSVRITNVVPVEYGKLSKSQYNSFIDEFSRAAAPIAESMGLDATVTSGQLDVRTLLGDSTFRALKAFSQMANRTTGATHPLDRGRWLDFLILQHIEGARLDGDILTRWFIEEERWPDSEAYDLGSQFEFARELLRAYDQERT
ncbi:hypothetical protein ACRQ5Q_39450 [Bradyrhizobium sp. PMVTL-01]|uniref:hypothetical protein n=1 Tax=Bradyrhizobium sp. PMVTL-01 TaxID=3434999 RepID=UPI003F6F4F2A